MNIIGLTDLPGATGDIDIFLVGLSFEERSTFVMRYAGFGSQVVSQSYITSELYGDAQTRRNLDVFINAMPSIAQPIILENRAPVNMARQFRDSLENLAPSGKRMLVDITSFTHEALLILFKLLWELDSNNSGMEVKFIYTGASEYSINEPSLSKWLSKGITDIRAVYGYPGMMYPSRKLHLVVLLGFELERTVRLISAYEPAKISVGIPDDASAVAPQHADLSHMFADRLYNAYPLHSEFLFSADDVIRTSEALRTIISSNDDFNTIVAPMNTKISTIGAALACLVNPAIQLCYAPAAFYNTSGYSRPGDHFYLFGMAELSAALAHAQIQVSDYSLSNSAIERHSPAFF